MKKTVISLIFLGILILSVYGDIIPEGSHVVSRRVYIENLDDFSEYTLIGLISGPMISTYDIDIIQPGIALNKGYKFNSYKILAIQNQVISKILHGIDEFDPSEIELLLSIATPVNIADPGIYIVEDANPLNYEEIVYTIQGIQDDKLIMYISQRTLKFNSPLIPDLVENYDYKP